MNFGKDVVYRTHTSQHGIIRHAPCAACQLRNLIERVTGTFRADPRWLPQRRTIDPVFDGQILSLSLPATTTPKKSTRPIHHCG